MLSLENFLKSYPDFKGNGTTAHYEIVQAKLDEAWLEIDPAVWLAKANVGHGLLTAQKLALSPFGRNAKMVSKMGETAYDAQLKKLQRQVWMKARPVI